MVVESQASRQITNARVLGKCSPTDHNPDPNSHPGLEEPWSGKRPARRTMSKGSSVTRGQNGSAYRALEIPSVMNKQGWKKPPLMVNKPESKTQHPDSANASPILLV